MPLDIELKLWHELQTQRFGPDRADWTYQCPQCGGRQSFRLFCRYGIEPKSRPYSSCIGRWVNGIGHCSYSLRLRHEFLIRPPEVRVIFPNQRHVPCFPLADRKLVVDFPIKTVPSDGPKRPANRFYSRFNMDPDNPTILE